MSTDKKNDGFSKNFTKIPNSIIRDPSLSPYAKTIYMLIRSYSPSYPSYSHILKETGIGSRSTISKGIKELTAKELVRIINSPNHKSNLYEFIPPQKVDPFVPGDVPPLVQEVDTNKTNLIKPNNNNTDPPTAQTVEGLERKKIFEKALSSLGTHAGKRYKPKKRPTFLIEAPEKDI